MLITIPGISEALVCKWSNTDSSIKVARKRRLVAAWIHVYCAHYKILEHSPLHLFQLQK